MDNIILPEITDNGCKAIKNIFLKYNNVDGNMLKQIIKMVRSGIDENSIAKKLSISKNKLYRYLCRWMADKGRNIWVKVSPRKRGKNNYNKFNAKIQDIISGLEHFNIDFLYKSARLRT